MSVLNRLVVDPVESGKMSDPEVIVTLVPTDSSPSRHFILSSSNPLISIGRSSKRGQKDRSPANDNGWFESRVMSRDHAELSYERISKTVQIEDLGSTHGTWLNNIRLPVHEPAHLLNGDTLRFGVDVERNDDIFPALSMRFKMDPIPQYATPPSDSNARLTYALFREAYNNTTTDINELPASCALDPPMDITKSFGTLESDSDCELVRVANFQADNASPHTSYDSEFPVDEVAVSDVSKQHIDLTECASTAEDYAAPYEGFSSPPPSDSFSRASDFEESGLEDEQNLEEEYETEQKQRPTYGVSVSYGLYNDDYYSEDSEEDEDYLDSDNGSLESDEKSNESDEPSHDDADGELSPTLSSEKENEFIDPALLSLSSKPSKSSLDPTAASFVPGGFGYLIPPSSETPGEPSRAEASLSEDLLKDSRCATTSVLDCPLLVPGKAAKSEPLLKPVASSEIHAPTHNINTALIKEQPRTTAINPLKRKADCESMDVEATNTLITKTEGEAERPPKRIKSSLETSSLVKYSATAVVSALLGGLGTIALLAALPADYFQ